MVLQWRPPAGDGASRLFYSPGRDIGYIGPDLMRAAMHALDEQYWEPWFRKYMADHELVHTDLVPAAGMLAQAFNQIIRAENPVVALEASGFADVPPDVQTAFYTKIGQVFLAAVWAGVKDLARPADDPPATFQEMLTQIDVGFSNLIGADDQQHDATGSPSESKNLSKGPPTGP